METITKADIDRVYRARQARLIHPAGTFDKAGRWFPSEAEDCGVSATIRTPSRAYPYSYMRACRSRRHIERLAVVSPSLFAEQLRQLGGIK